MAIKMTFTLDEETAMRLRRTAERLGRPKSQIVREAIEDYSLRAGRLSERERLRLLKSFDELVPRIPKRPALELERELAEIRRSRRAGGRRSSREDR